MGLFDTLRLSMRNRIMDWLFNADTSYVDRALEIVDRRAYRMGVQRQYLKPSRDGYNDNQISNYIKLIADRSVSMLVGKSVEFDFGEANDAVEGQEVQTPVKDWIDEVWKKSHKGEILQRLGYNGVEAGMCFCKIVPMDDTFQLVALDSSLMDIKTNPYNMDDVEEYVLQYKASDRNGKEMGVKEITRKNIGLDRDNKPLFAGSWTVELWENSAATSNKWELIKSDLWDYEFPPIVHWQNMINIGDAWGLPEITPELIGLQDQYNFNCSNRNKIIRYYAHPMRYSKMLGSTRRTSTVVVDGEEQTDPGSIDTSPNKIPDFNDPEGGIFQLDALGDLPAVLAHLEDIRRNMFETTRTVDVSTIKDRMGALTNFGLRVIYQDALQKLETKRELYGWGLIEINRRLLLLSNQADIECDLLWPDALPENEQEETVAAEADLRMGIVSKQTVSEKRGYTWEDEQMRQNNERSNEDDLGGALLRAFDRNGGIREEQVR